MGILVKDSWKIIQEGFSPESNRLFESLMSSGNGRMGLRGNHEEDYSGDTLKGAYVAGVYYPDKTRVGWWKNGYPEYFAKVLNATDFIGIKLFIDGEVVDLAKSSFHSYYRELDMKESVLRRSFVVKDSFGAEYKIETERFVSYDDPDLAAIRYSVTCLNQYTALSFLPFLNGDVKNEDANYDEKFWDFVESYTNEKRASMTMKTKKTEFTVSAAFSWNLTGSGAQAVEAVYDNNGEYSGMRIQTHARQGTTVTLEKYIAVVSDRYYAKEQLAKLALSKCEEAKNKGYDALLGAHKAKWAQIWHMGDITVEGDVPAQQGIRFNIYQLNCTYSGDDPRLNIGPKGFTGEKYGGSTYWDTEAYCLYFYLGTRNPEIARNLLVYRHNQLEKAKENAAKLGVKGALYPMVTMNGEECHNEWEITFEEIHRNAAITYAIKNYTDYTGDTSYLYSKGIDVLVETSRFWVSRANYNPQKQVYMILGVTGPNEYENNVSNNWYTNRMASWSLGYTVETLERMKEDVLHDYQSTLARLGLTEAEIYLFKQVSDHMYLPEDQALGIFLQQDGYLDKDLKLVSELPAEDLPLNRKWSWDKILRSCFIKQADVLQGLWFLNECYSLEEKTRNFDFYEPRTVHESSLSPCVHAILAAEIGKEDKAYELYLRTARLDLDNYNKDTDDGLHITSMAGTWMSFVYGFGGLRIKEGTLHLAPFKPRSWQRFSFHFIFKGRLIKVSVDETGASVLLEEGDDLTLYVHDHRVDIKKGIESRFA